MPLVAQESYLACHDCQVLGRVVAPNDAAPDDDEEYREFVARHAAHRTDRMRRQSSEGWSDRPLWDPMATLSFEVSDGRQTYLVQASRPSIDEPRVYRFTPGTLEVKSTAVTIDDRDVRRGLDMQIQPHSVRSTKLDRFMAALHEVVSAIAPQDLDLAFDAVDDPNVSMARMPETTYRSLLSRCTAIFDASEWPLVHEFLRENRAEDGLLALRVHREPQLLDS